jgi:hypothetical protein
MKKINAPKQGCQMVSFQTKNPNLGIFWSTLEWKILYFLVIWAILRPLGIFYICAFGNFVVIWYIFPALVYCTKKNLATLLRNFSETFLVGTCWLCPKFNEAPCSSNFLSTPLYSTSFWKNKTRTILNPAKKKMFKLILAASIWSIFCSSENGQNFF